MVEPIDYQLVLTYPDRDDTDTSDFTSFEGAIELGQVLTLPEKGEWRVEEIDDDSRLRLPRLICVPASP